MAKQATATVTKPGVVTRVREFFQEVQAEMSKVAWPTKEDVKASTSVVVFLLVALAAIIGFYDKVFQLAVFLLFRAA